jgi:hypothetical protein
MSNPHLRDLLIITIALLEAKASEYGDRDCESLARMLSQYINADSEENEFLPEPPAKS